MPALPDFEKFKYTIAIPPTNSKIEAWNKLREAERRLEIVKWAETLNDPRNTKNRTLFNDAVSAFLLTFEATIQFLKNQFVLSGKQDFDAWLKKQSHYDLTVRGLRTLRHFEAHVEAKSSPRCLKLSIRGNRGNEQLPYTEIFTEWMLPKLRQSDISKLRTPRLDVGELPDWNKIVFDSDIATLFTCGLKKLKDILNQAESIL